MYIHDALFSKVGDPIAMGILFYLVSVADGDGNVFESYADIGNALGYTKNKVFRCVHKLASINAVKLLTSVNGNGSETVAKRSRNAKCAISVCNIRAYKTSETLMKRNGNASETQKWLKEQKKTPPEVVQETVLFGDEGMDAAIRKWLAYKKERKQTYKPKGLTALKNRLMQLSGGNPDSAAEIVDFSIANNYVGLFAPKQQQDNDRKQLSIISKVGAILED